ncbi:unnamed protein product (macronuclear) [Paramecium tetraurelia]|uniref:Uncharacterized protein n=1 Tax=Paramecium tetraurelia TaxID=5888 RepID=A0DHF8_PARTE|nr:uncharacterized protein GSPATT00016862001 [Paramecium tetraurelia]CAK82475.1 unnamed protein product [Paramecium tetraurelia]|eukprot:XP_001449872.1 hypothetical protein (macronuclear) [Paramecium tetraurelia strain d4-2]
MNRLRLLRNLTLPKLFTRISCLTLPYLIYHTYRNRSVHCSSEIRQMNQSNFVQNVLGNRKDYFFLVIYKDELDGGYGEKEAIEVAKKLQQIADKLQIDCHVYTVSRPSLKSITKLVNSVKNIKIYEEDEYQKIDIFFKTPHSDDYVYFPFKKHNFYQENNIDKILTRVSRFIDMYQTVTTKEQFESIILESYYQLDSPVFIKSNSQDSKLKLFKKTSFQFLDKKTVDQNSKFLIIENKELCQELNLKDDDILLFRNDILQKYQNCIINEKNQIIPQLINKQQVGNLKYESFNEWKQQNSKLESNTVTDRKQQKNQFTFELQQFSLPRVFYLKNSRKCNIAAFIRKIQNHKNQNDKLVVSLQLDPKHQNRLDNHIRISLFFRLYEKYKDKLEFVISATNQLEELLPHLNKFQSRFVLFNIFNSISYSRQLFPQTAKLYEKYFLKDIQFVERFEVIDQQLNNLLQQSSEERIHNIDYLSQDLDKIQEINLDYFNFLNSNQNNRKQIILYYQNDAMTDVLLTILKDIKTNLNIYTISSLNQIPALYSNFPNQNVLILNGTAIGFPKTTDTNLNDLRVEIEKFMKQYL